MNVTFQLFDKVRIKDKNVVGTIVEIHDGDDGQPVYTVERQKRGYVNGSEGQYEARHSGCRTVRCCPTLAYPNLIMGR